MRSRKDVIERALWGSGAVRFGGAVDGRLLVGADEVLKDFLYELRTPLNFDASVGISEEVIPFETAAALSIALRFHSGMDALDPKRTVSERVILYKNAVKDVYASVVGENNVVERVPENF